MSSKKDKKVNKKPQIKEIKIENEYVKENFNNSVLNNGKETNSK